MDYNALLSRLQFVVFGENSWRLKTKFSGGEPEVSYDAHGQSVLDARRTIRNIINISRMPIHLVVIHGFHHGTAIKDMLANEKISEKLTNRFCPVDNPGETLIDVAA